MEMRKFIEDGAKKAGNNKALARILNQSETILSDVKAGKKGLNDAACIKLADFIGVNPLYVIAASNLVTEKDEEKRKIFESCFTRAASAMFALAAVYNFLPFADKTEAYIFAMSPYFVLC